MRNRLKQKIKSKLIKLLNMDFDVEERANPRPPPGPPPESIDETLIPKVVDGSGDTPGPNHKEDIGRTWCSAQLAGGVPPFFIDIRPPNEVIAGVLPGAIIMSGETILNNLDLLPPKEKRVTIYDQTGELGSTELAIKLREAGWPLARRLRGGFAEWLEFNEPIETLEETEPYSIGDAVRHNEKTLYVHRLITLESELHLELWDGEKISHFIKATDLKADHSG